ncbi:MAG: hypothetical protein ACK5MW_02880 [Enterococcus sp.]
MTTNHDPQQITVTLPDGRIASASINSDPDFPGIVLKVNGRSIGFLEFNNLKPASNAGDANNPFNYGDLRLAAYSDYYTDQPVTLTITEGKPMIPEN